jgi:hypothetical protein
VGGHSVFDNSYYHVLLGTCQAPPQGSAGAGQPFSRDGGGVSRRLLNHLSCQVGFQSDSNLLSTPILRRWVQTYAADNARFLADFRAAFIKTMELGQDGPADSTAGFTG